MVSQLNVLGPKTVLHLLDLKFLYMDYLVLLKMPDQNIQEKPIIY